MKKEHNIVFLDLDQVLFDYQTFFRYRKVDCKYKRIKESCYLLKDALIKTKAKVVFITSWNEDKLNTAVMIGELRFLKRFLHKQPFVDAQYRCGDRQTGILNWLQQEYGLSSVDIRTSAVNGLKTKTDEPIHFAVVDDSTGLYMSSWCRTRLVPVINQRLGNFEAEMLCSILTGENSDSIAQELKRRRDIYKSILAEYITSL